MFSSTPFKLNTIACNPSKSLHFTIKRLGNRAAVTCKQVIRHRSLLGMKIKERVSSKKSLLGAEDIRKRRSLLQETSAVDPSLVDKSAWDG